MNLRFLSRMLAVTMAAFLIVPALKAEGIILTSDQQLRDLQDPDKKIDMSSLREWKEAWRQDPDGCF